MVGGSMHISNIYGYSALIKMPLGACFVFPICVYHNKLPLSEVKKPEGETVDKPEGGAAKDKDEPLTSS